MVNVNVPAHVFAFPKRLPFLSSSMIPYNVDKALDLLYLSEKSFRSDSDQTPMDTPVRH